MNDELVVVEKETALQAFSKEDGLQYIIDKTRAVVEEYEHDVSTATGRKKTASLAHNVSKLKVYLDGLGKDLVADWKAKAKAVDLNRKSMRDQLEELRDIARKPLTEWEEAEAERVESIEQRIYDIGNHADKYYDGGFGLSPKDSEQLQKDISYIEGVIINDTFQELANKAAMVKDRCLTELKIYLSDRLKYEAEQAELERLRKEEAERKQKEYEDNLKKEAAEKATKEAEEKARAEQERLEREKQEAIDREEKAKHAAKEAEEARIRSEERAKIEKEQAVEKARLEEISRQREKDAKEKADREKREANKKHVDKVTKEAVESFVRAGVGRSDAELVVCVIKDNKIPNVKIEF